MIIKRPFSAKKRMLQNQKMKFYYTNINKTLKGWQPKVILLNHFINDLAEELKTQYPNLTHGEEFDRLRTIDNLIARDIDYVIDSEYMDCIKFILEQWKPGLIRSKEYIRFVYNTLDLKNVEYEDETYILKNVES